MVLSRRNCRVFASDFETTVYKGQIKTEVWASASVELYTEDVKIFHSIEEQLEYFISLKSNVVAYYHNLKFDGNFWLSYFLQNPDYKQAYYNLDEEGNSVKWKDDKTMMNKEYKYCISDMGQWYFIKLKINGKFIEFRDSYKLLPFSLDRIGKSFKTKHKKLTMEYEGFRYAGCEITDEEKEYISNDVYVLKEALEIMFDSGHKGITIGACCLSEFKKRYPKVEWNFHFPNLKEITLNPDKNTYENADEWIRKSYRGGWCYLVAGKENKIYTNGTTADVNSLYPSMMSSESGNIFPFGKPHFWNGDYIPDECFRDSIYYFVRIKTRFYIKNGYLPFIQIKDNLLYRGNESLVTSDVLDKETGEYHSTYIDATGKVRDTRLTITMTMTDFKLFLEHYDVVDFEILDGCWFDAQIGLFDEYINKYKEIKINSTGAQREQAKLFLNNLYGKFATSDNSSFKIAYLKDDKSVGFRTIVEHEKDLCYIPIGSAITSYARNFTIRAAQKNYYGVDKAGFIYADTDSIHCDLLPEEITGITVHDKNFCCWKLESQWDVGYFARQKTYIEHVIAEDLKAIDNPYYNVKCAGMPKQCKDLFIKSITGYEITDTDNFTDEEKEFLSKKRDITDFKDGLLIPSKLMPKRINGGVILVDTTYEMRPRFFLK